QAVGALCNRGLVLERGRVVHTGPVDEAIGHYLGSMAQSGQVRWDGDAGDEDVRLLGTALEGGGSEVFRSDEPLRGRLRFQGRRPILGLVWAAEIYNQYEQRLVYSAVDDSQPPPATEVAPGTYHWELTIPANTLAAGNYRVEFDLGIHQVRRII